MVDGFPYKEEVGGSSPSVPTTTESDASDFAGLKIRRFTRSRSSVG